MTSADPGLERRVLHAIRWRELVPFCNVELRRLPAMDKLRKHQWWFSIGYLLCALLSLYFLHRSLSQPQPRQLSYSDFLAEVNAGHVAEVHVTEQQLIGILKDSAAKNTNEPHVIEANRLPGIDETSLIKQLETERIKFSGDIQTRPWW